MSEFDVMSTDSRTGDEWPSRFTQYVDQSTDRLRRTWDLNRQLTRRIAHGDVPPVVVESRLAEFLSRNAQTYTNEMAGVALHFLSALVDVNADYVRELMNVTSGEAGHDVGAPPAFDPADTVGWYARLTEYAANRSEEIVSAVRAAVGARDARSTDTAADAGAAAVARLADVFLSLMSRVDGINAAYGSRYLEELLAMGRPAEHAGTSARARAQLGEAATIKIAVCNTTVSTATVRCVMTDLRRSDGVGPAFEPIATITPSHFSLAAGQEEAVTVSIALEEPAFVPGPIYSGSIRILGIGDGLLDVPIEIRASVAAHELSAAELP